MQRNVIDNLIAFTVQHARHTQTAIAYLPSLYRQMMIQIQSVFRDYITSMQEKNVLLYVCKKYTLHTELHTHTHTLRN